MKSYKNSLRSYHVDLGIGYERPFRVLSHNLLCIILAATVYLAPSPGNQK